MSGGLLLLPHAEFRRANKPLTDLNQKGAPDLLFETTKKLGTVHFFIGEQTYNIQLPQYKKYKDSKRNEKHPNMHTLTFIC